MMMPNPFQHSLSGKDGIHTAAEFRNEIAHGSGNSFVCLFDCCWDFFTSNFPFLSLMFFLHCAHFIQYEEKQRSVLCELLTVCHCFRYNVSYRLLCDVLRLSASPFRYKKMQCHCFLMQPHENRCWIHYIYLALQENVLYRKPYLQAESISTLGVTGVKN